MSKRYPLINIENYWTESALSLAQKRMDSKEMKLSSMGHKGLYMVSFSGNPPYEVEVKIIKNEVRKYTCDCPVFLSDKSCDHIPSALLLIRKKASQPTSIVKKKKKAKRLHTNHLVDLLDHDELKLFIKDIARKDPVISMLFKARFIRSIELEDGVNKYEMLLNSLIKLNESGKVKLTRHQIRLLNQMLESLLLHIESSILEKSFVEAFDILQTCLRKIHLIIDRNEEYIPSVGDRAKELYKLFAQLVKAPLAPNLKKKTAQLIVEISSRSAYRIIDLYSNIYTLGWPLMHVLGQNETLLNIAIAQSKKDNQPYPLWIALICKLIFFDQSPQNLSILSKQFNESDQARANKLLLEDLQFELLLWLYKHIEFKRFNKKAQALWLESVQKAALAIKDDLIVYNTSIDLFILTRRIHFYEEIITNGVYSKAAQKAKVEKRIKNELVGRQQLHLLAQFYQVTEQPKSLLKLFKNEGDFDLLLRYDVHLLPKYIEEINEIYLNLIRKHMNEYGGTANVHLIRKWMEHFEMLGQFKSIDYIFKKLKNEFPERTKTYQAILKNR